MSDPLARPATPSRLHRLRAAGVLDAAELRRALALALRTPPLAAWHRFLDRALLGTGAALVLAGILYFFARNWAELGRFSRFTIVEAAILIAALVAWRGGLDRLTGQVGGLAVAVLAGVALAVIGQSYQLGADPWRLFAITAALGVPWLVATRFAPLFVLLLVLVHISLVRWWPLEGEVAIYKLLLTSVGLDALAWMAWERVPDIRRLAGRWVPRLLALGTLAPLTGGAIWLMIDDRALQIANRPLAWQAAVLAAWVMATAASLWFFARWRPDLFVLALSVVGLILVVAVRMVRAVFDGIDTDSATSELLLTALILTVAAGIAATWLRRLQLGLAVDDDGDFERAGAVGDDGGPGPVTGAASAVAAAGGIVSSPPPIAGVLAAVSAERIERAPNQTGDATGTVVEGAATAPSLLERAAAVLGERGGESSPWYVRLLVAGVAWLAALALFGAIGAIFFVEDVSLGFGLFFAVAVPFLARRLPADEARGARAEFLAQWVLVASLAARILVAVGVHSLDDSVVQSLLALAAVEVWFGVTVPDRLQRFLAAGLAGAWLLAALMEPDGPWLPLGTALPLRTALVAGLTAFAGWLWLWRPRLEGGRAGSWHGPVGYGLTLFALTVPGVYSLAASFAEDAQPLVDARVLSAVLVALLLVLWHRVVRDLGRSPIGPAALVVAALVVGLGVAAWPEPGLLAAIGALALAFHVRARRLGGLAIVAVALFVWLYYYHLQLDFFSKALVLAGSGLVLLAGRSALERALRAADRALKPSPAEEVA